MQTREYRNYYEMGKLRNTMNTDKGTIIELTITDMTDDGKGIGHVEGMTVFVDGTIPGDEVKARVIQDKKRYLVAECQEILSASEDRIDTACPYFGTCGGCSLQNMKYDAQLRMKKEHVRNKLERIGGLENPAVHDVIAQTDEYGQPELQYRNKATFAVYNGPDGPSVGFRQRGSHRVIDICECLLQKDPVMAVANAIRELIRKGKIRIYKEPKKFYGRGAKNRTQQKPSNVAKLREFTVKACEGTGEMMVVLTVSGKQLPNAEEIIYAIDDAVNASSEMYALESVILEVKKGDIHELAKDYIPLAGKRTILDHVEIGGRELDFEISGSAFYQVNTKQMVRLYETAQEYANLQGEEVLFDLYCGIGTIGLSMVDKAAMVVGIEEVPGAVLDANRNAVINGIVNARYYTGKAEEILPRLLDSEDKLYADYLRKEDMENRPRVVVLDPPRGGCAPILLETVASIEPERIVYISCDAGTLARDIKVLRSYGYEFQEATPVEMFGMSMHVESVALLIKERSDAEKHSR